MNNQHKLMLGITCTLLNLALLVYALANAFAAFEGFVFLRALIG